METHERADRDVRAAKHNVEQLCTARTPRTRTRAPPAERMEGGPKATDTVVRPAYDRGSCRP